MRMGIRPIRADVLVRVVTGEKERGGIVIPDEFVKPTRQGVVLALGPWCSDEINRGDTVLLPEKARGSIRHDRFGTEFQIIPEEDLIGVVEG